MTLSVTDKTSYPVKVWRRHTDSPSLWVAVVIASLSLHLLAFWLIRSYQSSLLWRQQSKAAIPIEFVEISAPTKSRAKAKTVSPKLPLSSQQSVPSRLPKTVKTTPTHQDTGAINSFPSLQKKDKTKVSQSDRQLFAQQTDPTSTPKPKPTRTVTPKSTFQPQPRPIPTPIPTSIPPIPTPIPTLPVGNLPQRQEIKLGKGKPLPSSLPSIPPETPLGSELKTAGNLPHPTRTISPTPTSPSGNAPKTPTSPTGETSQTSNGGASVATIAPLPKDEVNKLIQQRILVREGLSDVMPVYQGSNTKQFDVSVLPRDSGLQTAKILASLIIDQNGNFQQAEVIQIEPTTLKTEKSRYEQFFNQLFHTEKFIPGQKSDRTRPELSNLYIWITIKPAIPN